MTWREKIALSILGIKEDELLSKEPTSNSKAEEPTVRSKALEPLNHDEPKVEVVTPNFYDYDEDEIDLSFEVEEPLYSDVALSLLGEQVQKTLTSWGVIGKRNLEAKIILEDSKSTNGQAIFYFDYSNEISPSDFYNFALKDNSKMLQNIEADIICDGVEVRKAGLANQNRAMIIILNGRV